MSARVIVRADGGPQLGIGHLRRCLSLASALAGRDIACRFAVGTAEAWDFIAAAGFHADLVGSPSWTGADAAQTIVLARAHGAAAIIVDSDRDTPSYLDALRASGLVTAAIEDLVLERYPVDLVVNGNADAGDLPYPVHAEATYLLGPRFSILRPEFWSLAPRAPRSRIEHVFLSLGGADPLNLMPALIDFTGRLTGTLDVTAVVGPFVHDTAATEASSARSRHRVMLLRSPGAIADVMASCDLAMTAAGQTLYELACAGCPAVAFELYSNQAGQLDAMTRAGAVVNAGRADSGLLARIEHACGSLIADESRRAAVAAAARNLVDGRGALRVAEALAGRIEERAAVAAASGRRHEGEAWDRH